MRRRAAVLGAAVAVLTQVAYVAGASVPAHDHAAHVHTDADARGPMALPAADPARGVVLAGLRAPSSGPCVGLLEVVGDDAPAARCTHGPDAAPADGRDVRTADLTPSEAADVVASAPPFTCDGDGTSGRRAHAIYAHAPDRADRFGTYRDAFRAIIADVQDEYRQSSLLHGASDPLLYRFTHTTPSGDSCTPLVDSVDLPLVTDDDSFGSTVAALEAMGYTRDDRRYLVFVDANILCGVGHLYADDRADPATNWNNRTGSPLFSRVDAGCWDHAETHELSHNIGAVQNSAPNSSGAGHCNDDRDLMCYADGGPTSSLVTRCGDAVWEDRLDCGGDDYFHPDPATGSYLAAHWNTADSGWLFTEPSGGGGSDPGDGGDGGGGSGVGTNAPTVSITSPRTGDTVDAPLAVRGSASDVDGDLDKVTVRVDGTLVRTLRPSGSTWSTSVTAGRGRATLTVTAHDAGGRTRSAQRSITVGTDLFRDDDGSIFEHDIETLADNDVTRGCNPPRNDRFCPGGVVTRGQMAAFLVRALDLPAGSASFRDTGGSTFRADVAALASAGITKGCNPPRNDRFCPDDPVTRGQMAAFLARALPLGSGSASFVDTRGSTYRAEIGRLAAAGVTKGCNPPRNDRFCPDDPVTRAQMAAFMVRALYS